MKTFVVYGTFECEIKADSASEARAMFDIDDADISVNGCYEAEEDDD